MTTSTTNFSRVKLVGDGGETVLDSSGGVVKIHNHTCTDGYALEVKSDPTSVSGTHFGIEATVDANPSTATSALGTTGVGGIGRLAASHTMTGGSLCGVYGQACNDGTLAGSSIVVSGVYGLIEDGGTYTSVSRVAAGWFDSHLTKTVTAGTVDLLFLTNNGTTTFTNAIEVYAGNKVTNLLSINSATGMVGSNTAGDATFANWVPIKISIDGTTHYLIAARSISAAG